MTVRIALSRFDPFSELAAFQAGALGAGALASFVGVCRRQGAQGAIERLELEHYPGFTETVIADVANALVRKFALIDVLVIHRVGQIAPGEAIVLAAALSAHRAQALAAVEELMDRLKTDAPFWKREIRADGAHWIEPTTNDRRRRATHDDG